MILHLQCRCGALHGQLSQTEHAVRSVCYCKDCRAYSRHLGKESAIHDSLGGIEVIATQAKYIALVGGTKHLACLSLSPKGLLRWYAKCCNSPIGNTPRNWKVPFVGLVHTCLKAEPAAYESAFPRVQMRVNTGGARQPPPGMRLSTITTLAGFMPGVLASALNGTYRKTPFFSAPAGTPNAEVFVLSEAQRANAYGASES